MAPPQKNQVARGAPRVIWSIVEEHLDEAEYLGSQWERGFDSPTLTLERMRDWEERFLANLDGLEQAGPEANRGFLARALERGEASQAFAAALAILSERTPEACEWLIERIRGGPLPRPLLRALALTPATPGRTRGPVEHAMGNLLSSGTGGEIAWALDVLAFRGSAAPDEVAPFLEAREPGVVASALKAARTFFARFEPQFRRALGSPIAGVRDAAIEAGMVTGLRAAYDAARQAVLGKHLAGPLPLWLVAMAGDEDFRMLEPLLDDERWGGAAVFALGLSGRARAVESCLPLLRHPKLARVAGEAVSVMSGIRIEGELCRPEPEEEPVPLEEDDLDADLVPTPEMELPDPAPEAVERAWAAARGAFDASKRYLRGKPFERSALEEALRRGPMRWRHPLALEVAIRTRGRVTIESRTWAAKQQASSQFAELSPDAFLPFPRLLGGSSR
jgi:uncharacterized protein (TIGR02270 family)